MTQCYSLNVKLSNSQVNKFKSAIKNENEAVLRLSSSMIGHNEASFPHKLLLTKRQVSNLCKAFANNSSTDIQLKNSIIKDDTIRSIFRQITSSITTKNRNTINKKCN